MSLKPLGARLRDLTGRDREVKTRTAQAFCWYASSIYVRVSLSHTEQNFAGVAQKWARLRTHS